MLTALVVQSPALIGLILTGKSIARLPELKGPRFAEYFLIGTFLSISLALLGGILLSRFLFGTDPSNKTCTPSRRWRRAPGWLRGTTLHQLLRMRRAGGMRVLVRNVGSDAVAEHRSHEYV